MYISGGHTCKNIGAQGFIFGHDWKLMSCKIHRLQYNIKVLLKQTIKFHTKKFMSTDIYVKITVSYSK